MDTHELDQTLRELHGELLKIELVDENGRRKLERLQTDIQALLVQREAHPPHMLEPLVGQLREHIQVFEVSHPTLTGVMNRTLHMLARMGI